jgi:geranylgeranyl pyrophosphate synthase
MKNSILEIAETVPVPILMRADPWPEQNAPWSPGQHGVEPILPKGARWSELLGLDQCGAAEQILHDALLAPIADLTSARGKRVRGQLVACSYRLLSGEMAPSAFSTARCRLASEAIEFIHAGSLIIDDIEDGSPVRRGRPALHLRYPMPIALNAGNWLYFWPFDLFKQLDLPKDQLLDVYEACHRTLLRAHFGQAIDLGTKIATLAQAQVKEVCLASMRLKTGALMGFAAFLGAAVAGAPGRLLSVLDDFGNDLGVALQMFDDLGNVIGRCEPAKRFEDLMLSHPSWAWACAASHSDAREYQEFLAAIKELPDGTDLETWMAEHALIRRTRESARNYLDLSFETLEKRLIAAGARWSRRALDALRDLGEEIAVAYE